MHEHADSAYALGLLRGSGKWFGNDLGNIQQIWGGPFAVGRQNLLAINSNDAILKLSYPRPSRLYDGY